MATKETVQYGAAEPRPGETKEGLLAEAAELRRQISTMCLTIRK